MAKGITEFAGSLRGMKRIQMRDIPEEEEAVREEFARVKKKLGIRSNIRLYRNDRITSPMLAGIFRCRVVLPDIAYGSTIRFPVSGLMWCTAVTHIPHNLTNGS